MDRPHASPVPARRHGLLGAHLPGPWHLWRAGMPSPSHLQGVALEAAWLGAHLAIYPLGLVEERLRLDLDRFSLAGLKAAQRGLLVADVEAAGTPILLVHGMVDNRSVFTLLRHRLRGRGFGRVVTTNYSPLTTDVRAAADALAEVVERLTAETGYERVHIIGHSLGGVIARYYVQCRGGDARVHTLVTLGSPHRGTRWATRWARLFPHPLLRQLCPGSDLVAELDAPAPGCRTRFVAFWSDLDQMISPKEHAQVVHPDLAATNVLVRGVGHLSLPARGSVGRGIAAILAQLDTAGTALPQSVMPITGRSLDGPYPGGDAGSDPESLASLS